MLPSKSACIHSLEAIQAMLPSLLIHLQQTNHATKRWPLTRTPSPIQTEMTDSPKQNIFKWHTQIEHTPLLCYLITSTSSTHLRQVTHAQTESRMKIVLVVNFHWLWKEQQPGHLSKDVRIIDAKTSSGLTSWNYSSNIRLSFPNYMEQGCKSPFFKLISLFWGKKCQNFILSFLLFSAEFWHFTHISCCFWLFFLSVVSHLHFPLHLVCTFCHCKWKWTFLQYITLFSGQCNDINVYDIICYHKNNLCSNKMNIKIQIGRLIKIIKTLTLTAPHIGLVKIKLI